MASWRLELLDNVTNHSVSLTQVRLNRRLMDRFPRADIAEGIFYEYLRYDDPISPELRERVVDGFPFLLAPLAQVKGSFGFSLIAFICNRYSATFAAVFSLIFILGKCIKFL